jgi:putative ABC transport system substrate-binding protein
MWSKRLELLRDLLPKAASVAILLNPNDTVNRHMDDMVPAARALGVQLVPVAAATDAHIEAAFSAASEHRIEALLVSDKPFLLSDTSKSSRWRHAMRCRPFTVGGSTSSPVD